MDISNIFKITLIWVFGQPDSVKFSDNVTIYCLFVLMLYSRHSFNDIILLIIQYCMIYIVVSLTVLRGATIIYGYYLKVRKEIFVTAGALLKFFNKCPNCCCSMKCLYMICCWYLTIWIPYVNTELKVIFLDISSQSLFQFDSNTWITWPIQHQSPTWMYLPHPASVTYLDVPDAPKHQSHTWMCLPHPASVTYLDVPDAPKHQSPTWMYLTHSSISHLCGCAWLIASKQAIVT